jgi:hypothetical protein
MKISLQINIFFLIFKSDQLRMMIKNNLYVTQHTANFLKV